MNVSFETGRKLVHGAQRSQIFKLSSFELEHINKRFPRSQATFSDPFPTPSRLSRANSDILFYGFRVRLVYNACVEKNSFSF